MPPVQQTPSFWVRCNQVTWYSKLGAIILFLGVIPALCFYIGMQYQEMVDVTKTLPVVAAPIDSSSATSNPYSPFTRQDKSKISFQLGQDWNVIDSGDPVILFNVARASTSVALFGGRYQGELQDGRLPDTAFWNLTQTLVKGYVDQKRNVVFYQLQDPIRVGKTGLGRKLQLTSLYPNSQAGEFLTEYIIGSGADVYSVPISTMFDSFDDVVRLNAAGKENTKASDEVFKSLQLQE